jgi:cytochrome P450
MKGMLPAAFTFVPRHHFFLPLLREANLRSFLNVMVHEAQPLLTPMLLGDDSGSGRVDLFDACRRAVMAMNLRVLFGPLVMENGRADQYHDAFEAIDPEKSLVNLLSSLLRPSQKEQAWATIRRITGEVLSYYESKVKAEGQEEGGDSAPFECTLHLLVCQAAATSAPLDLEAVTGDLFAFVFASFTNTFAIMGWCAWELAGNAALRGA